MLSDCVTYIEDNFRLLERGEMRRPDEARAKEADAALFLPNAVLLTTRRTDFFDDSWSSPAMINSSKTEYAFWKLKILGPVIGY